LKAKVINLLFFIVLKILSISGDLLADMKCTSCKISLLGDDRFTSFPCPNCGEVTISRCSRCKTLSVEYVCEKCGFRGP
jgi:predicted RNA-binding Zn-ribbon protein involved in translation (DUF1610 family)